VVTAVNDPPVAVGDVYHIPPDRPLFIYTPGLLANDYDVDGDPMLTKNHTPPTAGSLVLGGSGNFNYTPPPGYTGIVTFSYRAWDSVAYSAPATVTIEISMNRVFLPVVVRAAGY
jgi:hypothetical protein